MTDRELLELAAKAAGIALYKESVFTNGLTQEVGRGVLCWNPLVSDGDAMRLAVGLNMCVVVDGENNHVRVYAQSFARPEEGYGDCGFAQDKCAATRRAIVRAAAEIGKVMQ